MNARPFLDTNILIYAFAENDARNEAAALLLQKGGLISVQVLNEFVNVSRKKLRRPWDEIESELAIIRTLLDPPLALSAGHHEKAVSLAKQFGFGIYDSLVIASAAAANCSILYTEDLQNGQIIESVTIRNPFRS